MHRKNLLFLAGILLALNVFCWQEVFNLQKPGELKVNFLSVGQGDAEFIETPQGHQILIDGGPDSAVLEKLDKFLPFWDKTIDVVVLTHPEKDHMTGLLEVLKRYKVKYFLWNGIVKNDAENKKLADILDRAQNPRQNNFLAEVVGFLPYGKKPTATEVLVTQAGERIKAGNVVLDVVYPFEDFEGKEIKNSSNDTCIVNRLIYGKNSFLFACDIDAKAEKELANYNIKSDVLKVAHHGSKYSTSEEFLRAVAPEVAVIEVGKNSYGHPTPETLQRLEKFGIKMKRTDQDGDVKITSDGKNLTIK